MDVHRQNGWSLMVHHNSPSQVFLMKVNGPLEQKTVYFSQYLCDLMTFTVQFHFLDRLLWD